jgi:hypothetical protein
VLTILFIYLFIYLFIGFEGAILSSSASIFLEH